MSNGLFLGKFMPAHKGHELMIRTAAQLVDTLYVLVGTQPKETLDGYERYINIKMICKDILNVRVVRLHKDLPQKPLDDPENFWSIWRKEIRMAVNLTDITYVFGSDDYIYKLAEKLGARALQIDPGRDSVPISSTMIRNDSLLTIWSFLPERTRGFHRQRVVILGPESTGKSTMAGSLSLLLGSSVHAYEYGRTYADVDKSPGAWEVKDFDLIRERQAAVAGAAYDMSGPICVEDTDSIQTDIWQTVLLDDMKPVYSSILNKADLYLLLSPEVEFVQDGTRFFPALQSRETFHSLLKDRLDSTGCNYEAIGGSDHAIRLKQAKQAVLDHSRKYWRTVNYGTER